MIIRAVLAGLIAVAAPICAVAQEPPAWSRSEGRNVIGAEALIGVRVLTTGGAQPIWAARLPSACVTCSLQAHPTTTGQNLREFYFHFFAPTQAPAIEGVEVVVDPATIRGVVVGKRRVAFIRLGDRIRFDAPIHPPLDRVVEMHTTLDWPGIRMRIEHPDPERRNGRYGIGPWPDRQYRAALNLEFAFRDALDRLGISRQVVDQGLGTVHLLGFDTNFPTLGPDSAHEDFPPHWHMHMYWSGAQMIRAVDHQYIGDDGLLTHNLVGNGEWAGEGQAVGRFERGDRFVTIIPGGPALWAETITPNGFARLENGDGDSCLVSPIEDGFDTGTVVSCSTDNVETRLRAINDLVASVIMLEKDGSLEERYWYDPDTALLVATDLLN